MPPSGVRISWLMLARNALLAGWPPRPRRCACAQRLGRAPCARSRPAPCPSSAAARPSASRKTRPLSSSQRTWPSRRGRGTRRGTGRRRSAGRPRWRRGRACGPPATISVEEAGRGSTRRAGGGRPGSLGDVVRPHAAVGGRCPSPRCRCGPPPWSSAAARARGPLADVGGDEQEAASAAPPPTAGAVTTRCTVSVAAVLADVRPLRSSGRPAAPAPPARRSRAAAGRTPG